MSLRKTHQRDGGAMEEKPSFTVHDLPPQERPRERMRRYGADKLSSQELLALVIGRGVPGESVITIAHELLMRFGSVRAIGEATLEELSAVRGIGPAKATQLKAAFELARRQDLEQDTDTPAVSNPAQVVQLIRASIRDKHKEHFKLILLDTRNRKMRISHIATVSVGTLSTSLVHPREVFREAITRSASSIIVAHNHPSGDPEPSEEDARITRRLVEAGKVIGIEILDHIIVTTSSYLSFREKGLL